MAAGQFQVNTYTTNDQKFPAVAVDGSGNFVVAWQSLGSSGTDTDYSSIQAQRYDSTGAAVGSQFQVNTYTTSYQTRPAVAVDGSGNFVVAWQSLGSSGTDTSITSIQAQRYNSAGAAVGSQFQVNTYTTSYQNYPAVAVGGSGNFVVAWQSKGSSGTDTDSYSIQAQRYDSTGAAVGSQFQVNTYTTGYQKLPAVAVDGSGNFIVVWQSAGSTGTDTSGDSIQAQRYNSAGGPVGSQFQVNTYTTSDQRYPAVAVDGSGNFIVAWQSDGSSGTDTSNTSIQAQRYNSAGGPVGSQFQVNTYTTSYQARPAVAVDGSGNFVVAWQSYGSSGTDTSSFSIQAQRYDSAGAAVGSQFQVNTYTTSYQKYPAVAVGGSGNFVVAWQSNGSSGTDTSGYSIQAQRYGVALTTQASASVVVGGTISDMATLAGGAGPTGTITFTAFANNTCTGTPDFTSAPVTVAGNGSYASGSFTTTAAGTYNFRASYSGDGNNNAGTTACLAANERVVVTKASPTLTAQASAPVGVGGSISDQATLSGGFNPTGTITFNLFAPGDAVCASSIFTSAKTVSGNGLYTSDPYTATIPGTYRWVASYGGDANNSAAGPTACSDPAQAVAVTGFSAAIPALDPGGLVLLMLLLGGLGVLLLRKLKAP